MLISDFAPTVAEFFHICMSVLLFLTFATHSGQEVLPLASRRLW